MRAADRPVFNQINLVVSDMAASIKFYERLGIEIQPTIAPWDRHHRTLGAPDGLDFDLDSKPQDLEQGVTFHFMHRTVRERALRLLFPAARHEAANQTEAVVQTPGPNYDKYYAKTSVIASLRFFADSLRISRE